MRIIVIWLISKLSLHFVLEIYSVVIIQSFFSRSFVKALEFSSVRFCLEVKPRDIDYYRYRMNIHTISNKTLAEFIVAVRGVCRQKWNLNIVAFYSAGTSVYYEMWSTHHQNIRTCLVSVVSLPTHFACILRAITFFTFDMRKNEVKQIRWA